MLLRAAATDEKELADIARARELQRMLYRRWVRRRLLPEGVRRPRAHARRTSGRSTRRPRATPIPRILQVPTFVPCAAVLLEFGTEEQKQRHIPAILKGEEIWMQFLSEPSGGSDVAAALTTAVRDGDEWVVNGSKIWTTGAWFSDYGLCLLRTNWDVPKHRGLSVFIIKIHQPGIELHRIEMINGSKEFCQEFITDLRVPDSDRVGDVDQGWTVGTRWMFHEKNAMGGGSPYVTGTMEPRRATDRRDPLVELADATGHLDEPRTLELIGEAAMLRSARTALSERITAGMGTGVFPENSAAIARLMTAVVAAAQQHHRAGARRAQRRGHAPRRPVGGGGVQLPRTPDVGHRRRHHRDGPQQHQRAGPRHAPGADRRQEHPVPRRPEGPARELSSRTDPPIRSFVLTTPVPRSWW